MDAIPLLHQHEEAERQRGEFASRLWLLFTRRRTFHGIQHSISREDFSPSPCFLFFTLDLGWVFPSPEPLINITSKSKTHTNDYVQAEIEAIPTDTFCSLATAPCSGISRSLIVSNEVLMFPDIRTMWSFLGQHDFLLSLVMILYCCDSPRPAWGSGDEGGQAKKKKKIKATTTTKKKTYLLYLLECTPALPIKRLFIVSPVLWLDGDLPDSVDWSTGCC